MPASPMRHSFRFHSAALCEGPSILRNKSQLVEPFYDGYVHIWFYLVLRTVSRCYPSTIGIRSEN